MRGWVVWALLLSGCSWSESDAGGSCARSTECKAGLVCIEGACTRNLEAIADPGTVPMLEPEPEEEPIEGEPDAATDGG